MLKLNSKSIFATVTIIISCLSIVFLQKEKLDNQLLIQKKANLQLEEEQLRAAVNLQKQLPSFGFDNLIADLVYLKYIQYFGDTEAREETGYSLILDYFKTVVKKDPRFVQANLSLSASNSIFAGRPEKTVALLEKSAESLTPEMKNYPFMVFAYKAVDEILFLGDLEAAQNSYLVAAEWADLQENGIGQNVANRFRKTVKFLQTNPDSSVTQVAGWSMVLRNNRDPKIQNHAINKIRELGGEVLINSEGEIRVEAPKKTS